MSSDKSDLMPQRPLALVSGASSGIGREFARQLAAAGYDLVVVARRKERLETLAQEVGRAHGVHAEVMQADLTDEADLARVEKRIASERALQLLVNNAGFMRPGTFAVEDLRPQLEMIDLHVKATVRLTRAALPGMLERNRGAVINVSSVAGFIQQPQNVVYSATKAFLSSFTEGLALELRGTNVKVQALCPGWTETELLDHGAVAPNVPSLFVLTPERVVAASLRCLARGKLFCVPSAQYRALVTTAKLAPRRLLHWLTMRMDSMRPTPKPKSDRT